MDGTWGRLKGGDSNCGQVQVTYDTPVSVCSGACTALPWLVSPGIRAVTTPPQMSPPLCSLPLWPDTISQHFRSTPLTRQPSWSRTLTHRLACLPHEAIGFLSRWVEMAHTMGTHAEGMAGHTDMFAHPLWCHSRMTDVHQPAFGQVRLSPKTQKNCNTFTQAFEEAL